jgi:SAM-dependent methyltransferase
MIKKLEQLFRKYFPKRMNNYRKYISALKDKSGLEIGGPSFAFTSKGFLPVYDHIKNLDGCNFSSSTIWEGNISEGHNYKYGDKKGFQIISDGSRLVTVPDSKYDFVLSCHSIEHIANPIKALTEWKRVIKNKGYILLVVPHKDNTFDHNRPVTSMEHLISDYKNDTQENDTTHFEEVISLHDMTRDEGVDDKNALKIRTADNFNNRCVHHHVFNTPLVTKLADYLHLSICDIRHFNPFHIIMLLQKDEQGKPGNSPYLNAANKVYHKEKFPSDKNW